MRIRLSRNILLAGAVALLAAGLVGGVVHASDSAAEEKNLDPVQGRFMATNNATLVAAGWDAVGDNFTAKNSRIGPIINRNVGYYDNFKGTILNADGTWQHYE